MRLLTDRRDELSHLRVQTVNRLQRLLTELIPGGAKRDLSALQAKRLLATVKPRTLVGKTMRRMAAEEIADLVAVDAKLKAIKKELRAAVTARGSHLMDLFGVGPPARPGSCPTSATWPGSPTATTSRPGPAPHRWTPPAVTRSGTGCPGPGTARLNHVLHIAAIVQIRHDTAGRAYYRRKLAESKTPMEALRCLKRRLSDAVYRQLVADADAGQARSRGGPGRALGGVFTIQRGRPVHPGHRLFGSATSRTRSHDATRHPDPCEDPRGSGSRPARRRAGAVKVERPTGRTTLTATSDDAHSRRPKTAPLTQRGTRSVRFA